MPDSTPTAWAHIPNARHIDRILQDLDARPDVWDAAWDAAWVAALTLIAWDDVAYILDLKPDGCRMLIETCADHHKHAAVLLLPACIVFNT